MRYNVLCLFALGALTVGVMSFTLGKEQPAAVVGLAAALIGGAVAVSKDLVGGKREPKEPRDPMEILATAMDAAAARGSEVFERGYETGRGSVLSSLERPESDLV